MILAPRPTPPPFSTPTAHIQASFQLNRKSIKSPTAEIPNTAAPHGRRTYTLSNSANVSHPGLPTLRTITTHPVATGLGSPEFRTPLLSMQCARSSPMQTMGRDEVHAALLGHRANKGCMGIRMKRVSVDRADLVASTPIERHTVVRASTELSLFTVQLFCAFLNSLHCLQAHSMQGPV